MESKQNFIEVGGLENRSFKRKLPVWGSHSKNVHGRGKGVLKNNIMVLHRVRCVFCVEKNCCHATTCLDLSLPMTSMDILLDTLKWCTLLVLDAFQDVSVSCLGPVYLQNLFNEQHLNHNLQYLCVKLTLPKLIAPITLCETWL